MASDWRKREYLRNRVRGTVVPGDLKVPATRWWNRWYLGTFVWKWILFEVSEEDAKGGYHVGFIPQKGSLEVNLEFRHDQRFAMRIGREACAFFAINGRDLEVPISTNGRRYALEKVRGITRH